MREAKKSKPPAVNCWVAIFAGHWGAGHGRRAHQTYEPGKWFRGFLRKPNDGQDDRTDSNAIGDCQPDNQSNDGRGEGCQEDCRHPTDLQA
jgi:hypothetical protein